MRDWAYRKFFGFMKVSGWLALLLMLGGHFIAAPYTGNFKLQLYFDATLIAAIITARLEGRWL